ncbi:DNA alkylation repair protein [bacterium]|nr:DNA alkylation repair protein [bacterium]
MKKSKFTLEIEKKLIKIAPKKFGAFKPEDYIKGNGMETSKLKFLNHSMPTVRNFLATLFKTKAESHAEHLFEDMQKLWFESDIFDAKIVALYWLDQQDEKFLIKNHKKILNWITQIDNWAHSDAYCSTLGRMFDHSPHLLLPTYKKWNKHKNSWHRRCSMVGTYYYSRMRSNPLDFATAATLVNPHFKAPEYYVQKGVGWTIREMYNVYPRETIKYIENNLHQLSPIAWVAASEKLPAQVKQPLLKKRKENRKK